MSLVPSFLSKSYFSFGRLPLPLGALFYTPPPSPGTFAFIKALLLLLSRRAALSAKQGACQHRDDIMCLAEPVPGTPRMRNACRRGPRLVFLFGHPTTSGPRSPDEAFLECVSSSDSAS